MRNREVFARLMAKAGIEVDGPRPFDVQIHDPRAYGAMLAYGSLGAGEAYMKGWWSCSQLEELMQRLFRANLTRPRLSLPLLSGILRARIMNLQSPTRASEVCRVHYDLDLEIFRSMLDERMVYTCAYWKGASSLEQAQLAKMDLICRKLGLERGMRLLDIGCGFGSFMKYAAETYGVSCVGYTLSKVQAEWARKTCDGLPVEIRVRDYRKIEGTYDRVVSIGMFEAVGYRNFRTYMEVVERSLAPDGLFLLHTVGHNVTTQRGDPWVDKYIFPNGMLPSIAAIGSAIEGLFVMEDWHNFGPDYARTLLEWNRRFQAAWPRLRERHPESFKRMWEFYLLSFCGGFIARSWQLWQIVFSKPGRAQPPCRIS